MKQKISAIYACSAIGDALGLCLRGLKPESVSAIHGAIVDYVDPGPHSADHHRRWCKKGFYSFITQLYLLLTDAIMAGGRFENKWRGLLTDAFRNDIPGFPGVFRNMSPREQRLLSPGSDAPGDKSEEGPDPRPQTFFACLSPVFVLRYTGEPDRADDELVRFITGFNNHWLTLASGLMTACALRECLADPSASARDLLKRTCDRLKDREEWLKKTWSAKIDMMSLSSMGLLVSTLEKLSDPVMADPADRHAALAWIASNCRTLTGLEVSRPGHPHPLAVCVLGVYAGLAVRSWPDAIFLTASQGGESHVSSAIAGALSATLIRTEIRLAEPRGLLTGLANYRQILLRAENLADGSISAKTRDFRQMEHDLTTSASLDFNRFLKDHPQPPKPERGSEEEEAMEAMIPKRADKRKWREYEREKTKEKRRRRH